MIKWFLDRDNKIPLYLQIRGQIEYHISTGALPVGYKLPTLNELAKTLGINFETVRKAYKDLESDGLITMKRGEGTFISTPSKVSRRQADSTSLGGNNGVFNLSANPEEQLAVSIKQLIQQYLKQNVTLTRAKDIFAQTFSEIEKMQATPTVIFTECNQYQVNEISGILSKELAFEVKPLLLDQLSQVLPQIMHDDERIVHIITTGFHVKQVRQSVGNLPVDIDILIMNLNPETRRQLVTFGEKAKYGIICRDTETAVLWKDLLKTELGFTEFNVESCVLAETKKVKAIIQSAEVLLTSPPVYEDIKQIIPFGLPIFNVFERIDPMSLQIIKEKFIN